MKLYTARCRVLRHLSQLIRLRSICAFAYTSESSLEKFIPSATGSERETNPHMKLDYPRYTRIRHRVARHSSDYLAEKKKGAQSSRGKLFRACSAYLRRASHADNDISSPEATANHGDAETIRLQILTKTSPGSFACARVCVSKNVHDVVHVASNERKRGNGCVDEQTDG